jgi:hypothetical protein
VFAKKYDPDSSFVQLNPVRLKVHLFFPENQSVFNLDLELRGVRITIPCTFKLFVRGEMISRVNGWMNVNVDTLELYVQIVDTATTYEILSKNVN